MKLEKKFNLQKLEAQSLKVTGYASLFDVSDQQGDIVQRGAFLKSLSRKNTGDIKMLWQHDPCKPIGVWRVVEEDENGLKVEGELLEDVEMGREALALLRAGAVTGLSIGYRTVASGNNHKNQRILREIDLWEVSLVTFPMLPEAQARLVEGLDAEDEVQGLARACAQMRQSLMEA